MATTIFQLCDIEVGSSCLSWRAETRVDLQWAEFPRLWTPSHDASRMSSTPGATKQSRQERINGNKPVCLLVNHFQHVKKALKKKIYISFSCSLTVKTRLLPSHQFGESTRQDKTHVQAPPHQPDPHWGSQLCIPPAVCCLFVWRTQLNEPTYILPQHGTSTETAVLLSSLNREERQHKAQALSV